MVPISTPARAKNKFLHIDVADTFEAEGKEVVPCKYRYVAGNCGPPSGTHRKVIGELKVELPFWHFLAFGIS
jgi:hypothetical protein